MTCVQVWKCLKCARVYGERADEIVPVLLEEMKIQAEIAEMKYKEMTSAMAKKTYEKSIKILGHRHWSVGWLSHRLAVDRSVFLWLF